MTSGWVDWVAVALIGGLVGTSELISRYKDAPAARFGVRGGAWGDSREPGMVCGAVHAGGSF